jgi:hypothetical protein
MYTMYQTLDFHIGPHEYHNSDSMLCYGYYDKVYTIMNNVLYLKDTSICDVPPGCTQILSGVLVYPDYVYFIGGL